MSLKQLGPYQIQSVLGQGGMGTVYAALHETTQIPAAVKVLSAVLAVKGNFRTRFESEIETLKRLKHPHIVELLGYGEQDGHLFYAMELVPGRSLHDELKSGRVFTVSEVIRYGIEISSALKLAHDSGVIHRDIKPANLLLTSDGHVKLTDFGIAKLFGASNLTAEGGIVGTVDFMSPEQADGKPVTTRSDLYSVGAVMYALIARRPPFTGRSLPQIVHALKFDSPVPLRRLAPDVPEELEQLILELLDKDPQKRVATSLILGNRLRALEHGLAARAAEPPPPDFDLASGTQLAGDSSATTDLGTRMSPESSGSAIDVTWDSSSQPAAKGAGNPVNRTRATVIDENPERSSSSLSHFTTIAEEMRRREKQEQAELRAHRGLLALKIVVATLLVLFLLGGAYQLSRPATADALYEKIQRDANADDPRQLVDSESEIEEFLNRYPDDPRATEVVGWQKTLNAERQQRQFDRRTKRAGDPGELTPVERLYAETLALATHQPETALTKFEALVGAFADDPQLDSRSKKTLELARFQIERLPAQIKAQQSQALELAQHELRRAEELSGTDPEAARRIARGIATLYGDKPWAASTVEQARKLVGHEWGRAGKSSD